MSAHEVDPYLELNDYVRFPEFLSLEGMEADNQKELADQMVGDFEQDVIELARVDPVVFSQYAFQWPIQPIHEEMHDLLTDHDRLIMWAPIEHGKTSQCSIARPIWELGRNPSIRIALISSTASLAEKSLAVIKQQIELNPRIRKVFPHLVPETRPKRMQSWTDSAIIVQRDDLTNRDFSIQALGIMGAIVGARLDLIILDDVLDYKNTLLASQRERLVGWFESSVESRTTAFGKIWAIGTAWHREDLMHVLSKKSGWISRRFDAEAEDLWPTFMIVDGKPCGWPAWRLGKKKKTLSVLEYNRQFRNRALSEIAEIFNPLAIAACFDGSPWDPQPIPEWEFYVGVDLNVKKDQALDDTSFFIARRDGYHKIVQRIISKNMKLDEIIFWFYYIEARYSPVIFLVENNAAQDYVRQLFEENTLTEIFERRGTDPKPYLEMAPRVQGFMTGSNKADPTLGLRGMTIEFEQKRWRIPKHKMTEKWKDEMVDFDPMAHTPDILMSSWFCHSAILKYRRKKFRTRSLSSGG